MDLFLMNNINVCRYFYLSLIKLFYVYNYKILIVDFIFCCILCLLLYYDLDMKVQECIIELINEID